MAFLTLVRLVYPDKKFFCMAAGSLEAIVTDFKLLEPTPCALNSTFVFNFFLSTSCLFHLLLLAGPFSTFYSAPIFCNKRIGL